MVDVTTIRSDLAGSLAEDIGRGDISVADANAILNGTKTHSDVNKSLRGVADKIMSNPKVQAEWDKWNAELEF